jgi:uncharacterized membrane protein YdjX (TVP38/TMEM64 family)
MPDRRVTDPSPPLKRDSPPNPARRWAKIALLLTFLAGLGAFFLLGGPERLDLASLQQNRDLLLAYTTEHYATMLLAVGGVYVLATALSIPGATVLSLTAGFLFGRWVGTLLIVVSATVGATLVFLAARFLFAEAAWRRMGPRARNALEGFEKNAFNYLLFLRLVPLFPFWLVNLLPAFAPIRVRTYITATALGILPGAFVFANLGRALGRIDSLDQLLSPRLLLALGLLGVLALVPVLVKKARSSHGEETP